VNKLKRLLARANPHQWNIGDHWVVLIILSLILIPFLITLRTVTVVRELYPPDKNLSPYGYTWSLTIFVVPSLALALWLFSRPQSQIQKAAFWRSGIILSMMGIVLDIVFGSKFLWFKYPGATLGRPWTFPGFPFNNKSWMPAEELVFYILGMYTVLLLYEVWFDKYNRPDAPRLAKRGFEGLHYGSVIFAIAAILMAWFCSSRLLPQGDIPRIFPGYFTFLVCVAFLPTALLFNVVRQFVNWRAFSFVILYILLISSIWEALLAVPYQWWGYQPAYMMGLSSNGLFGLPIEAVLVWIAVSWTAIIVYEYMATRQYRAISLAEQPLK
jgi:hypothetical protein